MRRRILSVLTRATDPKEIDAYEIVPNLFIKIYETGTIIIYVYIGNINNLNINSRKKVMDIISDNLEGFDWDIKNINEISQDEIKEYDNAMEDIYKQLLK